MFLRKLSLVMDKQNLIRKLHHDLEIPDNYHKSGYAKPLPHNQRAVAIGVLKEAGIIPRRSNSGVLDALVIAFKKLVPEGSKLDNVKRDRDYTLIHNMDQPTVDAIIANPHDKIGELAKRTGKSYTTVRRYRAALMRKGRLSG